MVVGSRFAVCVAAFSLAACAYGEKSFDKFAAKHPRAALLPVEFVKQKEAADCGAAALTSVGRFWGADIATGAILRDRAPANPAFGYSIGELHEVSGRLGFGSSRLLERPDYLLGLVGDGVPVIAAISKPYQRQDIFDFMLSSILARLVVSAFVEPPTVSHYVVVVGSDAQLVYLLDPQDGYRVVARDAFLAQWSDLTLEFLPDAGDSVAGLAAYRAPPEITIFEAPGASSFASEIAGFAFEGSGLAAEGATVTYAP